MGNLATPASVQKLQSALHAKAKEEPGYRFYLLYDKMYRADVLEHAYRSCRANAGAAGVDGQRFEDIEAYGVGRWLGELTHRLKTKTYEPQAVKRVWIPKPNSNKLRPLGIPTIADRVVQTAVLLVLDPIFEADLAKQQYAYRRDRGAHDAVRAVHSLLNTGHTHIVDADLSGYFDSIPHAELLGCVARRIVDRHILHLIKMWLVAPVEDDDGRGGGKTRSRANRDNKKGTPQGAPISPLMSNLYMRRFIEGWRRLGFQQRWSAHIVNYADDFVICCKHGAVEAASATRRIMRRLRLTVNEDKTHLCQVPRERFDFLGYTFGRCYSSKDGHAYIGTRPSKKSVQRMVASISEVTDHRMLLLDAEEVVRRLNRKLTGWANYFCLGPVSAAYQLLDTHACKRLRRWLCKKHQVASTGSSRYPDEYLHEVLGLIHLAPRTHDLPWANA